MSSEAADVVVIGGGIVGGFTAYHLARAGARVVVVDPAPGEGASKGNAGMLVPSYCIPMSNPRTVLAGVRSMVGSGGAVSVAAPLSMGTLWWLAKFGYASRPGRAIRHARQLHDAARRGLEAYHEFLAAEQLEVNLRASGWLSVARSPRSLSTQLRNARTLSHLGVRADALDGPSVRELEPALTDDVVGGVLFRDDAAIDPTCATRAVLAAAVRYGAELHRERVLGVVRGPAGRAASVVTPSGTLVGRYFVIAAGAASAAVARLFGGRLPVEAGHGWSLTLPASGLSLRHALLYLDEHVVINADTRSIRVTGGLRFGGPATGQPPADEVASLRESAERVIPELRSIAHVGSPWQGARPMTPSGMPLVGALGRCGENVVVNTGHGTLGMTLAPVTGRAVASSLMSRIRRTQDWAH